jgi:hypothetical protein
MRDDRGAAERAGPRVCAPKVPFTVVMFGKPPIAIVRRGRRYVFVVEAYLRDFRTANRRIYRELMALPNPRIPPPD